MHRHSLKVGFSSLFESAFKKTRNAVSEASAVRFDPIPWRLSNRNVLSNWFVDSVQIEPAVKDGAEIPDFGSDLTYPFVGITGYSLEGGKYAKGGHEADFQKRSKKGQSEEVADAISAAVMKKDGAIRPDDYIFMPDKPISSQTYRITGGMRRFTNEYRKVRGNDYLLDQQVLSLDADGKLFVDKEKGASAVLKKIQSDMCVLSKLEDNVFLFARKFNITNRYTIIEFFNDNVRRYLNSSSDYGEAYGNPNYFRFDDYFRENGCEVDGKIDPERAKEHVAAMTPTAFVTEFVWKYWLRSDVTRTYVWTVGREGYSFSKSDLDVYKALVSGAKVYVKDEKDEGGGKSVEDKSDEGKEYAETPNDRVDEAAYASSNYEDVHGDSLKEAFFNAMTYVMDKPNHRESIVTFTLDRENAIKPVNGEILSQSKGMKRVFVRIDPASDNSLLDFKPIFDDSQFASIIDQSRPKTFIHREISGTIVEFPIDADIEGKRLPSTEEDDGKGKPLSNAEIFKMYDKAMPGDADRNRGGFHVSVLLPNKKTDEKRYFLCTGYEEKPTQNSVSKDGEYSMTPSLRQTIERVKPSIATKLGSVLWYNPKTDKDDSKQHIASWGKSIRKDDAGRGIALV